MLFSHRSDWFTAHKFYGKRNLGPEKFWVLKSFTLESCFINLLHFFFLSSLFLSNLSMASWEYIHSLPLNKIVKTFVFSFLNLAFPILWVQCPKKLLKSYFQALFTLFFSLEQTCSGSRIFRQKQNISWIKDTYLINVHAHISHILYYWWKVVKACILNSMI